MIRNTLGLISIFALAVIAFMYLRATDSKTPIVKPQPTQTQNVGKSYDAGTYFDWQLDDSQLGKDLHPWISVPLLQKRSDRFLRKLVRKTRWKADHVIVDLRTTVYWSDGRNFEAQHVLDAFERAKSTIPNDAGKIREFIEKASLRPEGKHRIILTGLTDPNSVNELLASRYLRPIRGDLIREIKGWQVSLGPYSLKDTTKTTVPVPGSIELKANPYYYESLATGTKEIPTEKYFSH